MNSSISIRLRMPLACFLALVGLATLPTGCIAQAKKKHSVYAELTKAPAKAVTRPNPLASDSNAVAAGAKLFGMHCVQCHGEEANGARRGPSLRADEVQQATPGALFWLLTNGVVRRGMPVWSKLPEPERWQLVAFIKSLNEPLKDAPNAGKP